MFLAVMSCFALAFLAPLIHRLAGARTGWLLAALPAGLLAYFYSLMPQATGGDVLLQVVPWVPGLEVNLTFYLDGLSLLFSFLILGVGTLIVIYAGGYLKGHPQLGRFFLYLLMFMGSMLGVVLASNIVALFVFWELTSFTSYLLIGFLHEQETSRKSALQALLVTGLGGLAMLAGLVLLALMGGSFELSALIAHQGLTGHALYAPALLLILAGAFTKSAQFPFHFWLPGAMAAPTPVSAYLHSATMVKAGVYLLARLHPALGDTLLWLVLVAGVGGVTMLVGAFLSLAHTDLKRLLAYSTVMALGTLTFLLGLGTAEAVQAVVVFLLTHALYKAALFMVAGTLDHETGTRDATRLSGLGRLMPLTFLGALVAALSMSGLPPLFGFVGKELIYEGVLHYPYLTWFLVGAAVLANVLMVAVAGIVAVRPFVGRRGDTPKAPHEGYLSLWLGPLALAILSATFGLLPALVGPGLMVPAASAVYGAPLSFYLALWHGVNAALILSAVTFLLGVGVYFLWERTRPAFGRADAVFGAGAVRAYEGMLAGLDRLASWQTRVLQSGVLRYYLATIIGVTVALTGLTLLFKDALAVRVVLESFEASFYEFILVMLAALSALFVLWTRSRLAAIASLGVLGYSVALLFILFSAPDLATTQLFVETLTVILMTLVVIYLPHLAPRVGSRPRRRKVLRDACLAVATGALMSALLLSVTSVPLDRSLTDFYEANSYVVAQGRNIVNVILVDFRALDTLGEIVVLALAGVGIFTLLKLRARLKEDRNS
jgi:multicomponent Na+:H+ antiporter subunit A